MYLWRGLRQVRRFAQLTPNLLQKKRTVTLSPSLTLTQLADLMKASPIHALESLKEIEENPDLHLESIVSIESAQLLAFEFNCLPVVDTGTAELPPRPPIVTIMGHVDHGKTTLLDSFRNSNICSGEYGGITQGIGAFSMVTSTGQKITFIDTPGHKAFSKMRERGAQVTDLVILVVCAVEGVQPQTMEAISHAKEAGVPIIVALNKIDLPGADVGKIELQLLEAGLDIEKFGGETMLIPISAKKRTNLDRLEEALLFKAELMELKESQVGMAQGTIIESRTLGARGKTCTALVRRGTLRIGDIVVAGKAYGKVKKMMDDAGRFVESAGPSDAVEIAGMEQLPEAGEDFFVVQLLSKAKFMSQKLGEEKELKRSSDPKVANSRISVPRMDRKERSKFRAGKTDILTDKMKLGDVPENLFMNKMTTLKKPKKNELARLKRTTEGRSVIATDSMSQEKTEEIVANRSSAQVNLILKASNKGMLEALLTSVFQVAGKEGAEVEIVRQDVGAVTQEDIKAAEEFGAVILGMDVSVPHTLLNEAKAKRIALKSHKIIYHLLEDVTALAIDLKAPPTQLVTTGSAEVRQVFKAVRGPTVAGLEVRSGMMHKRFKYRVKRDGAVVANDLEVESLRRHKQDVSEVPKGMECGMILAGFDDYKEGDVIEAFEEKKTEKLFKVEQRVVESEEVRDK